MTGRRERGFTLLEMLVAITLFLLLVSLGYGALRTGARSMEAADKGIAEMNMLRIGWNFIHNALSRAEAVDSPIAGKNEIMFAGEGETIQFVSDMPAYLGFGGLYMIRISVVDNNGSRQLQLSRIPLSLFEDWDDETYLQKAILVDKVEELKISYYGSTPDSTEKEWRDRWEEMKVLPLLVKIEITRNSGDNWPLLIARLRHAASAGAH